jgi:excisionase family DNA binding protein
MQSHVEELYVAERTLLTREQVAERLHVSPRTVTRLVSRGELRVVRLGRLARYRPSDVAVLVEKALDNDDDPAATGPLAHHDPAIGAPDRGSP